MSNLPPDLPDRADAAAWFMKHMTDHMLRQRSFFDQHVKGVPTPKREPGFSPGPSSTDGVKFYRLNGCTTCLPGITCEACLVANIEQWP